MLVCVSSVCSGACVCRLCVCVFVFFVIEVCVWLMFVMSFVCAVLWLVFDCLFLYVVFGGVCVC